MLFHWACVAIDTVARVQCLIFWIYDCAPDEQTNISIFTTSTDKHFESVSTHFPHFMPYGRSERMREANPLSGWRLCAWQAMKRMEGIDRACVVSLSGEIRLWNAWTQDKTPLKAGFIDIWICCHLRLKTPSVTMLWGQTVLAYQNAPQIPVSHRSTPACEGFSNLSAQQRLLRTHRWGLIPSFCSKRPHRASFRRSSGNTKGLDVVKGQRCTAGYSWKKKSSLF